MLQNFEIQAKDLANVLSSTIDGFIAADWEAVTIFKQRSNETLRVRRQGFVALVPQIKIVQTLFRLNFLVYFHALIVRGRT